MTDIDAPARYAEPAADQTGREGNGGLVVALALGLAVAAVALAMISREMAGPFVLAILGGLAVVGVFCLFAPSASCISGKTRRNDVTKAFVTICRKARRRSERSCAHANEAYGNLLGLEPGMVQAPDRAFAAMPICRTDLPPVPRRSTGQGAPRGVPAPTAR
jgi:two-component system cell cycle sensor histidine kinase/response regulator CckA